MSRPAGSPTPTPTATVGEALSQHSRRIDYNHPGYGRCRCGFDPEGWDEAGTDNPDWSEHATAAVLEALAAANFAVVQLTEPLLKLGEGDKWQQEDWAVWTRPFRDYIGCAVESPLNIEGARAFAAALLAAAVSSLPTKEPNNE